MDDFVKASTSRLVIKLGVVFRKLNKLSVIFRNGTFFLDEQDFNNLLVIPADRCGTMGEQYTNLFQLNNIV
jgi:hypothetical protein